VHLGVGALGSIDVAAQVQHAVQGVQEQLVFLPKLVFPSPPAGLSNADNDFPFRDLPAGVSFQRKGQNIRWARDAHELFMQRAHARVADECHRHLGQRGPEQCMSRRKISTQKWYEPLPSRRLNPERQ
jgi:hypothetical protein